MLTYELAHLAGVSSDELSARKEWGGSVKLICPRPILLAGFEGLHGGSAAKYSPDGRLTKYFIC